MMHEPRRAWPAVAGRDDESARSRDDVEQDFAAARRAVSRQEVPD